MIPPHSRLIDGLRARALEFPDPLRFEILALDPTMPLSDFAAVLPLLQRLARSPAGVTPANPRATLPSRVLAE